MYNMPRARLRPIRSLYPEKGLTMPRIYKLPQRLDIMMQRVSKRLRKAFILRTNPVMLHSPDREFAVSYPERQDDQKKIPINVSPARDVVAEDGQLTNLGEFCVAERVAAHLAFESGYSNMLGWLVQFNEQKANELGPIISENFRLEARKAFDSISQLLLALVSHNILAGFGYDPLKDFYGERYGSEFPELAIRYSGNDIEVAQDRTRTDINVNSAVFRIFMMDGIIRLSKYWFFLSEGLRQELLESVDPIWAKELRKFLTNIGLDYKYEYLIGPRFEEIFTPDEFRRTHKTAFNYLADNNEYLWYKLVESKTLDEQRLRDAKSAFDSLDFFAAYHFLSMVTSLYISPELTRAEHAMKQSVYNRSPHNMNEVLVHEKVAQDLAERGFLRAAIIFQERVFGIEAELD